jgi:hypothetical protein
MDTNDKKKKLTKLGNIVFIGIIMFVFLVGLTRTVFFPQDINSYENRYSNKISAPSVSAILKGTFQSSIEDAFSDQIPLARRLKSAYNDTTSAFTKLFVEPIIENNNRTYINYRNNSKIFGGYYVAAPYALEQVKDSFSANANKINALIEKYPDVDFYTYYIEKETDINFETGEKLHADQYLFSLLKSEDAKKRTYTIDNFEEYADYFYKTDHHWKHTGAYRAYKDIVDFMGCEDAPIEAGEEVLITPQFGGSHAAGAGSQIIYEPFYAYEFDFPAFRSITGAQVGDYGLQEDFAKAKSIQPMSYGQFYGWDDAEVVFDTGKTDRDNVLVIGNSYDNAILKLMATHFNRTHSIDLRHYERVKGSKFNFQEYMEQNDIDKVLFVGNVVFYASSDFVWEK